MPRRLRLAEQWDSFARALNLQSAPEVRRKEMRRAFYAGAAAFYQIQMTALDAGDGVSEGDLDVMAGLDRELREFGDSVKAGRA